jgi:hypothetical protein
VRVRRALILLLIVALAPGTWLRSPIPPPSYKLDLRFVRLNLPSRDELARHLGPFRLEAAWRMESPHAKFGGYSALVPLPAGQFLAIGDRGYRLRFSPPGAPPATPTLGLIFRGHPRWLPDAESATRDPASGSVWLGFEGANSINRFDRNFDWQGMVKPRAMRDWGGNLGPEAMVRMPDGRFLVLCEGFTGWFEDRRHHALLFPRDPLVGGTPEHFIFEGPAGFSPSDMAQLPDGRVLILVRRLIWPMPFRFAGRIVLADPAQIRPGGIWRGKVVADLASPLPVDNFEGIAVVPRKDGKVTVWLISDDNGAVTQSTILWKMALDPAMLPGSGKEARGGGARIPAKSD